MKIKIKSASRRTFWYANQIGSTFNVKKSDIHKDDYMLDENLVDSELAIKKSDCEVIEEPPTFQEGINEGFEEGMMYDGGNSKYVKILRGEYKRLKENQKEPDPIPQPEPFDLKRALNGDIFLSVDGLYTYRIVGKSKFNDKLHIVEIVGNGGAKAELLNMDLCHWHHSYMAPKEPEYLEGWVIVDKYGIAPCIYPDVKSASHSAVFNNADRKFRIEKIRFPKP